MGYVLDPVSPTANRNADSIEAIIGDLLEVVLGHPRIPMLFEDARRFICSVLAQGVFVHDLMAIALVGQRLEDGGSNPSEGKSATDTSTPGNATHGSRTSHPPMLTPRTFSEPQENWTSRFESGELSCMSAL